MRRVFHASAQTNLILPTKLLNVGVDSGGFHPRSLLPRSVSPQQGHRTLQLFVPPATLYYLCLSISEACRQIVKKNVPLRSQVTLYQRTRMGWCELPRVFARAELLEHRILAGTLNGRANGSGQAGQPCLER